MSDWLPRLLPALLAVTATLLAQGLCSTLLPSHGRAARTLLWLLFGSLAWAACTQVVLFDHLLAKVAG